MGNGRGSGLPKGVKNTGKANGYKIYKTMSEINKSHGQATQDFENKVNDTDMYKAIKSYTGTGYEYTNPLLRDKRYANMTTDEMFKDLKARANKGEIDMHTYKEALNIYKGLSNGESAEPFVGYRGAGFSLLGLPKNATFAQIKALEGSKFRDTGNMSISMIKGKEFDRPVLYEVHVPAGKGIGANVMGISQFKTKEAEFLFNNGAVFKIKKVTKTKDGKPYVVLEYKGRS